MGIDHSQTISEEAFWDWLSSRITPSQLSEMYRYAYDLNSYYVPQYRFDTSILNEMAQSSAKRVREAITLDKSFQKKYSRYDRQFISSLLDYMEFFLKDHNPLVSAITAIKVGNVNDSVDGTKQESTNVQIHQT